MDLTAGRDQNCEPAGPWKAVRRARRRGPVRARYQARNVLAAPPSLRARIRRDSYDNAGRSRGESEPQAAEHRRDVHVGAEDESQWCSGEKASPDENAQPPL